MTAAKHTTRHFGAVLIGTVLTLLLALCMGLPAAAFAAPGDTTYTIRLYGGNRGAVNGQNMVEWSGVPYGGTVNFSSANITITDGKYYAKGVRPAGLDNVKDVEYVAIVDANGKLSGNVTVTEDADYVIAYGVLADRVEYTVRYVDTAGNELAASQKFMGDVGDIPAAAAPYFEGYVPNAYNASLTLTSDSAQNMITFTYARLAPGYTTIQNGDGTIAVVTPAGGQATLNPAPSITLSPTEATAGGTLEDAERAIGPDGEEILTEDGTPLSVPVEDMIIADDEVALSSADDIAQSNATASVLNDWVSIALIVAAAILLVVAIVLWRRNRAKDRMRL